jgi:hypothetical protein
MEVGSTDAPPAHRSPPPAKATPPRLLVVSRARQRLPPPTLSPPPKQPAPPSFDHLPPFEAILLIMETHFPPAVIGRLTTFQQLARSAYDDAGLPRLEDLRQMTLTLPVRAPFERPLRGPLLKLLKSTTPRRCRRCASRSSSSSGATRRAAGGVRTSSLADGADQSQTCPLFRHRGRLQPYRQRN